MLATHQRPALLTAVVGAGALAHLTEPGDTHVGWYGRKGQNGGGVGAGGRESGGNAYRMAVGRTLTLMGTNLVDVSLRPLLVVLGGVFAGLATLLAVTAMVTAQPLVLLAAVPLALTAGVMWYQGTGRLARSMLGGGGPRRRYPGTRTSTGGSGTDDHARSETGDRRWEEPFDAEARREARTRARRQAQRSADGGSTTDDWGGRSRRRADRLGGLTRAEAYQALGLDPTASDDEVRDAYRDQAKDLHPDTEGGSADAFQELNDAYERIVDE